jgi:hypothetical protein
VILGSRSEEGDQQMVETTDLLGGYEFSQVPVGTYELTVYRQGAANHHQTITVEAREALEVDVRLQNSVTLSGVVTMPPGWSSPGPEEEGDEWHVWLMTEEGAYGGGGTVHPLTLEYVSTSSRRRRRGATACRRTAPARC